MSALAFGLLALAAELVGRSLTHRVDVGRHVATPSYAGTEYYPILLGVVKGAIALLLARLLWRLLKAHAAERAARRLLGSRGPRPRLRITLSPRLTLTFFAVTAVIYLVQADAEGRARDRLLALVPEQARTYCTVETAVVEGSPHREILRQAAERSADLIVMGVRGRGAIDLAVFGSTTQQVMRAATCPVLVVRRT